MGLKLSTSPRAITTEQYRDIVQDAVEINAAVEALGALGAEMNELETIQANVELCMQALNTADGTEMLKIIDAQESVAALCGVAESKLTKAVAMEGLGESVKNFFKNMWKKIREFFAKVCDIFRRIFSNAEGELKHLEKLVAAENDKKFDPTVNVEVPCLTKQAVDALTDAVDFSYKLANQIFPHVTKFVNNPQIKAAVDKVAASGAKTDEEAEAAVADSKAELEKIAAELTTECEKVINAADKSIEANPFLAKFKEWEKGAKEAANSSDPLELFKYINANFIKSGTIADLGWKSGNDLRQTVTKFTAAWRNVRTAVAEYDKILQGIQQMEASFAKIGENFGLPKDLIKCMRIYLEQLRFLVKGFTKSEHTFLIGVTRIVRKCYK